MPVAFNFSTKSCGPLGCSDQLQTAMRSFSACFMAGGKRAARAGVQRCGSGLVVFAAFLPDGN
jgi:hypothetical protein